MITIEQSVKMRFVTLPTGDQTAIIWAVDNQIFTHLLNQGLIKLSPEEKMAMNTGKAIEEQVI